MPCLEFTFSSESLELIPAGLYHWIDPHLFIPPDLWESVYPQLGIGQLRFDHIANSPFCLINDSGRDSENGSNYQLFLNGQFEIGSITSKSGFLALVQDKMIEMLGMKSDLNKLLNEGRAFSLSLDQESFLDRRPEQIVLAEHTIKLIARDSPRPPIQLEEMDEDLPEEVNEEEIDEEEDLPDLVDDEKKWIDGVAETDNLRKLDPPIGFHLDQEEGFFEEVE